jgi:transketolase
MKNIAQLEQIANKTRKTVLKMIYSAGSGHLGSSFSTVEVLTALYFADLLSIDPKNPEAFTRDYFLLSNGHACPTLYALLAFKGFFKEEKLIDLRKFDSGLEGHPKKNSLPGVEISSGSLGMGISQGIGLSLGLSQQQQDNQVVVMISDGELQEGSTWEALLAGAHFDLGNLTVVVDRNKVQIGGYTEQQLQLEPLHEKFASFNWQVSEINGHDFTQIIPAFKHAFHQDDPNIIISHTLGCKGLGFIEGQPDVHHPHIDDSFYQRALKELENE